MEIFQKTAFSSGMTDLLLIRWNLACLRSTKCIKTTGTILYKKDFIKYCTSKIIIAEKPPFCFTYCLGEKAKCSQKTIRLLVPQLQNLFSKINLYAVFPPSNECFGVLLAKMKTGTKTIVCEESFHLGKITL